MSKKHTPGLKFGFLLLWTVASSSAFAVESAPKTEAAPEKKAATAASAFGEGTAGSYLASQFAQDSGDVDAAITYLSSALARNPTNAGLASQLLSMQVSKGDMNAALVTARALETSKIKDPLADLLITVSLIGKSDYAGASKKLASSFDYANGQLWLPLVDAWMDAGRGAVKQPITLEEMPVTVGRAAAVISYHLALINAHANHTQQAATNFTDAVEEPESAPLRIMQQLRAFSEKNPKLEAPKTLLNQYLAAHKEGITPLESPIATPQDGVAEVLYTMGNVMQIAGVRHDATVYMQLARYLRPNFYLASFSLSEILSDGKAYKRASDVLATIPASSQYSMKATLRQALILDRMGKTQEALDALSALAIANPKVIDPWVARGDLLRVHNRFLEASIAYSEAINRIGEATPKDWAVFYARGACMERLGRWSEAKADLQKSLALNPSQPDVLNYLGYGMITHNESPTEAKAMLEKALAGNPNDPQIIDSMGWALYMLGEYKNALPYLERAVELLASDATVNDHLGDVYWRLGRKTEARFQWERALTYKPEEAEVAKITAKIATGLPDVEQPSTKSAAAGAPTPTP